MGSNKRLTNNQFIALTSYFFGIEIPKEKEKEEQDEHQAA